MKPKIFYRERLKVGEGEKKPRFRLVATAGIEIDFFAEHLRKKELDQIAREIGAELVLLESGPEGGDPRRKMSR